MSNVFHRRGKNSVPFENLEQRTLFSGYAISVVAPLPALSTTFVNTQPSPLVRDSGGNLYGVDPQGGAGTYGTVYEVNSSTKALTVLYTFDGTDGVSPLALAIDSSGNLFGIAQYTTATGSGSTELPSGSGNLFEITAANRSTATVLYTFSDTAVGTAPTALLVDPSNNVDVLADGAGANDGGAILQFSPASGYGTAAVLGSLTTTHFVYSDTLVRGSDGTLYGTSADGGGSGQGDGPGTLFELSPGSSTINTIATFDPTTTGSDPEGTPYVDASGNVFGTAQSGTSDANFGGDVWEYAASTGMLTAAAEISDTANVGSSPIGGVIPDGSGNLLGVTYQGGGGGGTVFSADPTTHTLTDVATLTDATTGSSPYGGLTPDGSGSFFGVTSAGGANSNGAVFEISPGAGGGTGTGTGTGGGTTTGTGTLTPTLAKSTLPPSVVSGSTTKGAIAVTVTNSGTVASSGIDTVTLYATSTGRIDSASTQIGAVSKKLPLKAGKSTKVNFTVKKLSLAPDTYTILAQTTDASGNTSVSSTGVTIEVVAPFVDLSAIVSAVKPTSAKVGKPVSFIVTITNTGNVDSTGLLTLAIGLSTDGTNLSVPITTITRSPKIKADGKAVKVSAHFKLPTDLDFVDYYPIVTITQGTSTLTAVGPIFSPIFGGTR